MKKSYLILTDSGGIQEEAPSIGKPVLVMREVTERIEGVEAGTCKLVGTKREKIVDETLRLLTDDQDYTRMTKAINPSTLLRFMNISHWENLWSRTI